MRSSTSRIRASQIHPRLHNQQWFESKRVSTDGFCDQPAKLNLSHSLYMGLSSGKATLSYRALAEVGLSIRQAWDQGATNLIQSATTLEGVRIDLRTADFLTGIKLPKNRSKTLQGTALEIRIPGAPVTSWLAHPRTFTLLNNHMELRLGSHPRYLVPTANTLIALSAAHPLTSQFITWADDIVKEPLHRRGEEHITSTLLIYRQGFPVAFEPARLALAA